MADLTREFFDRPENDDTLQNIRKQYLESKRNLQDLMLKQNDNEDVIDQSSKIRKEFKSPLKPKEIVVDNKPTTTSDNLIMMNEVRSLRSLVYEQQAQIRRLQTDLQSQKDSEFEFQRTILQFQSQLKNLGDEMAELRHLQSYSDNSRDYRYSNINRPSESPSSPPFDDSTTRLIQVSGRRR